MARPNIKDGWSVVVVMTDLDILERCASITGIGHITGGKSRKPHWKPQWRWGVGAKEEREWLTKTVYPLLGKRRKGKVEEIWPEVAAKKP